MEYAWYSQTQEQRTACAEALAQAEPAPTSGAVKERYTVMQRVLEKMAKQLLAYDEASLMQLWQQYATQVGEFEPTKRWEEAAVILCLIQAVRWKNQLFNYQLAATATPGKPGVMPPVPSFPGTLPLTPPNTGETEEKIETARQKATVLHFPDKNTPRTTEAKPSPPDDDNEQ